MKTSGQTIAFLPGDGVGPEVLAEARRVLETVGRLVNRTFEIVEGDIGGVAIARHDVPLPSSTIDLCKKSRAVLMGAVGDRRYDQLPAAKKPERGLLELRKLLGNYANLRPVYVFDSLAENSPVRPDVVRGVDLVFVRELLGGMYFGTPRLRDADRAVDTEVYSVEEVRRVAQTAFQLARRRRKHLTSVDKANVLETSILWRQTVAEVARDFPDVTVENLYVDNCAMQLILKPKHFDVVLTNNLFGDILSDEAAVLAGSLGMLPSAALGGSVGLYEPVHGSAPDIAGTGQANPLGAIASAAMMLEHSFELPEIATLIHKAIDKALGKGLRTRDLYPQAASEQARYTLVSTREMGEAVCGLLTA